MIVIDVMQKKYMEQVIFLLKNMTTYTPNHELYEDIWRDFISQDNVHSIVALIDKEVVGYGSIVIETKIRGGKVGHVEDIISHPCFRKKGVGKKIAYSLLEIAKRSNCYKTIIQCNVENLKFYEKYDYKISGIAMENLL